MREYLIQICPTAIWCIVGLEILVAILLFAQAKKAKQPLAFWAGVLTLGLILDAALIGFGSVLDPETLAKLSPVRFLAHGLLIPLLLPICGCSLGWKKPAMIAIWIGTVLLMAAGVAQALFTVLELREIAGVKRYAAAEATPRWASLISQILSFGTVIPMIIAGIAVWIKQKNPCLFFSGFLMFAFSALGPATGNTDLIFFISMFGELLMVFFLWLCAKRAARKA